MMKMMIMSYARCLQIKGSPISSLLISSSHRYLYFNNPNAYQARFCFAFTFNGIIVNYQQNMILGTLPYPLMYK